MPQENVLATYDIASWLPPAQAAEVLAGEQSTGTFVRVPGETEELRRRFAATVLAVEEHEDAPPAEPLPGAVRPPGAPEHPRRATVRIAFPLANFGPSLPNLLAAVAGNLFELRELAAVRLTDLVLPPAFAQRHPGPQFGVAGTRRLARAPEGVLIGTIVKPGVGLGLDALRVMVRELAEAGIDFIKDDELNGNPPHAPLRERVAVVTEELNRVADRTGRRPMYAFNITDDLGRLRRNHDLVLEHGGSCVMVCVQTLGLPAVAHLREYAALPIHGHRAMSGALLRGPNLGISARVFTHLARLAGVDQLHIGGIRSKFWESDEDVLATLDAARTPFPAGFPGGYRVLPVLSSGQSAGLAHRTWELTGTTDLLVLAGGGIHGHPDGPAAGVAAMRDAWAGAVAGVPLADCAAASPPLRRALAAFGRGARRG
ncbi:RuBisCO large subunit C-terminal-like domain-containing protein [Streptomyces hoynatensis]|uniref:Ribulose 1,5-bisphosphate carboxylase n=1 Tax=Streptomyces hoynatensis TaxID=1141874 RepID=A0A3A9ZC93_9ACTN|nr:RuBisCO large subunit C-terminal-like domain-containing protein [Streptomyces hoynatensis]RKN44947.1 ribulose 1,5-bisphosphate carboxylase [Streptomyces hoynatensis]